MSQASVTNPDRMSDDDMLSCIICKSVLRDPVLLRCLHNACSKCLDQEVSRPGGSNHITCRACDVATDITRRTNNPLIFAKIQNMTAQREAATCGLCREEDNNEVCSDGFCIQCQMSLCVSCLTEHRKHNKQHRCVPLDDTANWTELLKTPSQFCKEHEAEMVLACFDCERPLCVQCGQSCYKGSHDVHLLNTSAAGQRLLKIKEKIEHLINDLDGSKDVLEMLTKLHESLQFAYDIHLNLLKQAKKAVIDATSTAFDKAVIPLKDLYDALQGKASSYVSSAGILMRKISSVRRYGRLVTSSDDAAGLLSQLNNVVSHLDELKGALSHLKAPVEASRLVHMQVRLPTDLDAIACSWIRPPKLCSDDPCCAPDDLLEYDEEVDYITKEAQLEKRIKDQEDLAKSQREEIELQLQQLRNREEKQQHQQMMHDDREKTLTSLQEKLDKLKTELEIRDRQQQTDIIQKMQQLDTHKNDFKLQSQLLEKQQNDYKLQVQHLEKQQNDYKLLMQQLEKNQNDFMIQTQQLNKQQNDYKLKVQQLDTQLNDYKVQFQQFERQQSDYKREAKKLESEQKDLLQQRLSLEENENKVKQLQENLEKQRKELQDTEVIQKKRHEEQMLQLQIQKEEWQKQHNFVAEIRERVPMHHGPLPQIQISPCLCSDLPI